MTIPNSRLYAGAALGLLLAAGLGFAAARLTVPASPAAAEGPAADAETPAGALALSPAAIQAADIGVEKAGAGGLDAEILAQASVVAAPDGQAVLTARAPGAVTRILKRLGDPVAAGETVAVVESREAAAIAAERRAADARAELARTALAREQRLFDQKVSPRQDLDTARAEAAAAEAEAQRARAAADAARVSRDGRSVLVASPVAGRITEAKATLGAFVDAGAELFHVADPRRIQVEAAVTAADAERIAPGDAATIRFGNGRTVAGAVRAITPALDPETRAATVVVTPEAAAALQPGELVQVRIRPRAQEAAPTAVVVPEEAVQTVDGREAVFVRTAEGFRVQPVVVGHRGSGRVEIAQGLTPGQAIAVRNAFVLKAELGKGAEDEE